MALLPISFQVPTMVTGNTQTSALFLPLVYQNCYIQVPTMTGYNASTPIWIQASQDGINFFRYASVESNTTPVGVNDFQISSGTSLRMVMVPNFCFQYMKMETSAAATAGITGFNNFKVIVTSQT